MSPAETLLAELSPLAHRARMRRMVAVGQRAKAGDAEATAIVDELSKGDSYQRTLALQSSYGSRDGELVVRAVRDASRTVRWRALHLVVVACNDAQAATALASIDSRPMFTRLALALHRAKRASVVDVLLATPAALAAGRTLDLLPLATPSFIGKHLDHFRDYASPVGWARLAKHRAPLAANEILSELAVSKVDPRARWRVLSNVGLIARSNAASALPILERLALLGEPLPVAAVQHALRQLPRETFDLLHRRDESGAPTAPPGAFSSVMFHRVARHLGPDRLATLVRRAPSRLPDDQRARRWYLSLGESDRRAVAEAWVTGCTETWGAFLLRSITEPVARERGFSRWVASARDRHGVIPVARLIALPDDLRHREARRILGEVPSLEGKPARLAYASLLPFDEAQRVLSSQLGHPEGEMRALAIRALMGAVLLDPASVFAALELAKSRRYEQDPVRCAMLDALASVPWARFPIESLPLVGDVVQHALDAADLSTTTSAHAERLVVRLFRVDPEWGAAWLVKVIAVRGTLTSGELGSGLLPRDMVRFEPALAALVRQWTNKERAFAVLWLARSLDRRLALSPSVQGALETLATEMPFVGVAASALALLRRWTPARFAALVPRLLDTDPSYVLLPVVARYVSCSRQDLLGRYLEDRPMTGRFATGRTHWVVDFEAGFGTWTRAQQATYAEALERLVADPHRDVPSLRFAIDRLAQLAFADPRVILPFVSDPRQPVREIAIDAVARLDGGEGVEALIACLSDARARWAIYALRRCFEEMPRPRVLAHLRAVPTDKVTVAKEVIRLLGEMGGDDAFAELLTFDRDGLHRDVRIAMLRAMWDHLDRPEAWALLRRAVADADWIVASRLADVPTGRLSPSSEAELGSLLALLLERPEAEARLALLARAAWLPLRDANRQLFGALVARMAAETEDEARAATTAAVHRMLPSEGTVVLAALEPVIAARRTVRVVLAAMLPHAYAAAHSKKLALGALDLLANDPLSIVVRIEFAGGLLPAAELAKLIVQLEAAGQLHFDALSAAITAVERSVQPSVLEDQLNAAAADPPNAILRRLAFAAFVREAGKRGWTGERRAKLDEYRADPSPMVAAAAAYVFPPPKKKRAASKTHGRGTE